jgi:hypothetical protein
MPDRSKGRGKTKCIPWSSRFGLGLKANVPTPEKFTVMKPRRSPKPTRGCSASKEEDIHTVTTVLQNVKGQWLVYAPPAVMKAGFMKYILVGTDTQAYGC